MANVVIERVLLVYTCKHDVTRIAVLIQVDQNTCWYKDNSNKHSKNKFKAITLLDLDTLDFILLS